MIEIGLQMTMIFENVLSDMLLKAANMTSKSAGAKGNIIPIIKITVNDLCCSIKSSYFLSVFSLIKRRQKHLPYQRVSKNKIVDPRIIPIQLVKTPTTG